MRQGHSAESYIDRECWSSSQETQDIIKNLERTISHLSRWKAGLRELLLFQITYSMRGSAETTRPDLGLLQVMGSSWLFRQRGTWDKEALLDFQNVQGRVW